MHKQNLTEQLQQYIAQTATIRDLSSPAIDHIATAEDYRRTLLANFARIGDLARSNNDILKSGWFPLIKKQDLLTDAESQALHVFSQSLLDAYNMQNLDTTMHYLQTERLLEDAGAKGNLGETVAMLDAYIESAFAMMHLTQRLNDVSDISRIYRNKGLDAAHRLLSYLPEKRFLTLPDEDAKKAVLVNARYISSLFDRSDVYGDERINREDLQTLMDALALADNPFYTGEAPSYNWLYHRFRTLQYIAQLFYGGNIREYKGRDANLIHEMACALRTLWHANKDTLASHSTDDMMDLYVHRSAYYSGRSTRAEYKKELIRLYEKIDDTSFSFFTNSLMLIVPTELTRLNDYSGDAANIIDFYFRLIRYAHRMPKRGSLSYMLTYMSDILQEFMDVPGGISFEEMGLALMASLHPPTYVHTLSISDFSACLTKHLIHLRPELFFDYLGTDSEQEVLAKEEALVNFAYHAALCHDIGKLFITEVIMTYGRNLFDEEFDLIKQHPAIGALLLERHADTAPYANIARFHHQWYDGTKGYPLDKKSADCKEKIFIDIVCCADCLDASTDDVGRSYKRAITYDDYLREVHEGSGTRYAPYLAGVLSNPDVRRDMEHILSQGRDENYRKAYHILSSER